jgi:hypothetical protein
LSPRCGKTACPVSGVNRPSLRWSARTLLARTIFSSAGDAPNLLG